MSRPEDRRQRPARPRPRAAVALATTMSLALLSAGCGQMPTGVDSSVAPPSPTGTPTDAASAENTPAAPDSGEEDSSFSFDDIASYESGLEVEIASASGQQATAGMTGAETTNGQMVVGTVLVRNGSSTTFDATTVLVTASHGADDTEAPLVVDPTGELANAFLGPVTAGEEATAGYAFAIPFSALGRVTITVDLGDGEHEPVSFTGAVERDG